MALLAAVARPLTFLPERSLLSVSGVEGDQGKTEHFLLQTVFFFPPPMMLKIGVE